MGFSCSPYDYYFQTRVVDRGMVNPVIILVFIVGTIGLTHIHILSWIVGKCIFHNPTEVICQPTVCHTSIW